MVVQARTFLSDVLRKIPAACPELPELVDQVDGVLHRSGAGIWTEIPAFVLFHGSGEQDSRERLVRSDLDVGICLVIL